MHEQSIFNTAAITSSILGTLVGLFNMMNAGTIFQSVLVTALSAAVSCIVSFTLQQWLRKLKQ